MDEHECEAIPQDLAQEFSSNGKPELNTPDRNCPKIGLSTSQQHEAEPNTSD